MSALDLANYMKERLQTLGITTVSAAQQSNISRQTWHKLLRADIDEARLSTLIKVAATLETHPLSLMRIYFYGTALPQSKTTKLGETCKLASRFIADITYPDNSLVQVGQTFEKIWEVINVGTAPWDGWRLQCIDEYLSVQSINGLEHYNGNGTQYGLLPLQDSIPIPTTQPGDKVRLAVQFRAPDYACTTISHWKSINANGEIVFPNFTGLYCLVKVVDF